MGFFMGCVVFFAVMYLIFKLTCFRCKNTICLVGKTAIVTGGVSGIGYETALILASRGCKVIVADVADTSASVNKITEETKNENVTGLFMDLSSFKSVRNFAEQVLKSEEKLDILICNAGIADHEDSSKTEDGIVRIMQINYFGHIVLVHYLLDLLKKSAPSRIVFTCSSLAYISKMGIEDMNPSEHFFKTIYSKMFGGAYNNSKLCVAAATRVLGQQLQGTGVTVNSCVILAVKTDIFMLTFKKTYNLSVLLLWILTQVLGKTPEEGAQILIHVSTSEDLKDLTGEFFYEGLHVCRPWPLTDNFCKRVWNETIRLCQLDSYKH